MKTYLREIRAEDFEIFKKYTDDKDIHKYNNFDIYKEAEKVGISNYLNRVNETSYAICLKQTDEMVGDIGFKIERGSATIGLSIFRKELWGKGIGFDAITSLLDILKEEKIEEVLLDVNKQNERGKRLYKKIGFSTYKEDDKKYYMSLGI